MAELHNAISVLRNRTDVTGPSDHTRQEIASIWEALTLLTNAIEPPQPDPVSADPKV